LTMQGKNFSRCVLFLSVLLAVLWCFPAGHGEELPVFGKDTVLVWEIPLNDFTENFVVRIACYSPDLLIEWEDEKNQGTVLIPNRVIMEARGFVNTRLFKSGADIRAGDETTVWLSRRTYLDLKNGGEVKLKIDRVDGRMTYLGDEAFTIEVNGSPVSLPVIKVQDSRKAEFLFLDREDNPLLVQYRMRHYLKTLVSITTDRRNTLRWIKDEKLKRLLQD
jgi:hypothetical protein